MLSRLENYLNEIQITKHNNNKTTKLNNVPPKDTLKIWLVLLVTITDPSDTTLTQCGCGISQIEVTVPN